MLIDAAGTTSERANNSQEAVSDSHHEQGANNVEREKAGYALG
jgi:hypothetical protein